MNVFVLISYNMLTKNIHLCSRCLSQAELFAEQVSMRQHLAILCIHVHACLCSAHEATHMRVRIPSLGIFPSLEPSSF